jgi:hypothetical protein
VYIVRRLRRFLLLLLQKCVSECAVGWLPHKDQRTPLCMKWPYPLPANSLSHLLAIK